MTRALASLLLLAFIAIGCSKKTTDTEKKETPKTVNPNTPKSKDPKPNDPGKKPGPTENPKHTYSGPDADLKERLEKAYFELRCLAEKSKPADLAAKQEEIYKKYGFKSVMDYTSGINKLKNDGDYWKQLLTRAKTHCKS
ncbi:MAG: hypothetical protein KC609_21595 [Myxococcales bacterium]|nr:hypothetical protein [Myxococcales bacterium]